MYSKVKEISLFKAGHITMNYEPGELYETHFSLHRRPYMREPGSPGKRRRPPASWEEHE
jgi:hypothetical protein